MTDDDQIIQQRINGRSVREIAKAQGCSVAEVNFVIERSSNEALTDRVRKHTLCLELARLDELQQVYYQRALEGDVQSGALVTKIIERHGGMLGLHVPQTAVLKIVEDAAPRETSTDRIETALLTDGRKKDDEPTTH
ncbi:MAG TPA: hypothetical protein VGJ20_15270 [Xanthobacteraceae bacterium]|jgi:hypothetical protein